MLDSNSIDLKREIRELKKLTGKERGEDIKYLINYVRQKKGSDGLDKVIAKLKKNGYKLPDIDKIDNMDWIPISLVNIFFIAAVKIFYLQEEDILEMGKDALSFKKLLRFYIKYFVSVEKTFKIAAGNWRKHYSFGEVETSDYDAKKKTIKLTLRNFKTHPFTCIYLMGVFSKVAEMVTGNKKIIAQETKCIFKGDSSHEFTFNW